MGVHSISIASVPTPSTQRSDVIRRYQRSHREKFGWSLAWGSGTLGENAAPAAHQKGAIVEGRVEQAGTASNIREDASTSSGVRLCLLSANHTQVSHLHTEDPCTGEAAIMICTDTKKDGHIMVKIHYNMAHHELTPRGGGLARVAGQSCLAGPSVSPAAPRLRAQTRMGVW